MEPGLGKTSVVLTAFNILRQKGYFNRLLVVAPLRVAYTVWPGEVAKWPHLDGLRVHILHGDGLKDIPDADVYVVNPEGLQKVLANVFPYGFPEILCIDESTRFKNTRTKRFKDLKKYLGRFKRRWILTGTPAPNGLMDLFGQIYLLDEGSSLGRYITHFRNAYFYQSGYGGYTFTPQTGAKDRIMERIDHLVYSMSAEDYLELPDLIIRDVMVDLPPEVMALYKELKDEFLIEVQGQDITALSAAAAGIKCRQIANGALYGEALPHRPSEREIIEVHNAKIEAMESIVEEAGTPVLCTYEFNHDRKRIQEAFGAKNAPHIGGDVTPKKSAELIHRFRMGDIPLLLGHPASMGHGIDGLQEVCGHIIMFGISWDLELYDQVIRRVLRQGSTQHSVVLHRLIGTGTLDERACKVLGNKDLTQSGIMDALKAELAA
jgi:SNF2 family DNA or RNA helicase